MARKSARAAQPADPDVAPGPAEAVLVALPEALEDPRTLRPNPANPADHPPEQMAAIADLIDAVGWVKPLVANRRTGLLVDGHARLRLALDRGLPAVPVRWGDWTEDQELAILAHLDPSGAQRRIDRAKFASLRDRLDASGFATGFAALDRLRAAVATDPFFLRGAGSPATLLGQAPPPAGPLPLEDDGDDPDDPDDPDDETDPARPEPFVQVSHVRMVQLFLDTTTFPEFQALVADLMPALGTDNATDTTLAALRECRERCAAST